MEPVSTTQDQQQSASTSPDVQQPTEPTVRKSPSFEKRIRLIQSVLGPMLSGAGKRIMLGGETGVGKTTFVQQFADILGFKTIVVEVPQVVEEQLINIPFIVIEKGNESHGGNVVFQKDDRQQMGVRLAKSNLVSQLQSLTKIPDVQYADYIKSLPKDSQDLIAAYEDMYPGEISKARSKYENILFFDEFLRTSTPTIRSILRGILNGNVGMDPLPKSTYVLYATNLFDVSGSLDDAGSHTTFLQVDYEAPSFEEWMHHMVSNQSIAWKPDVIQAFEKHVKDENLSYSDPNSDIRTSPRRWSEIILAINNFYPFDGPDTAGMLISTLRRQFENDEQVRSPIYEVVEKVLNELIDKSKIDRSKIKNYAGKDWKNILAFHVKLKTSVGKSKKYIPVLQGLPGIGKTSVAESIAKESNLRYIPIECPTIEPDHVVGIPILGQTDDSVEFVQPQLHMLITKKIKESEDRYKEQLSRKYSQDEAEQRWESYQNQPYKYLIFFDEINRVKSVNVFNALRRVILEKTFNDQYKLPSESLVVAAMNPTDSLSIPLTGHFRDAIEIIDVEPNWKETLNYLQKYSAEKAKANDATDESVELSLKLIEEFPKSFADRKKGRSANEFYINIGSDDFIEEVYLNPRDYDNLFLELCQAISSESAAIRNQERKGREFSDQEIVAQIAKRAYLKFKETIKWPIYNQIKADASPDFYLEVFDYIVERVEQGVKLETSVVGFDQVLMNAYKNRQSLADNQEFINYMVEYEPSTFVRDITEVLSNIDDSFSGTPADRERFYLSRDPDSLYSFVSNFVDAVEKTKSEPDSIDKLRQAVNTMYVMLFDKIQSTSSTNTNTPDLDDLARAIKLSNAISDQIDELQKAFG